MKYYYIEQNENIVLVDTDKQRLINTIMFKPQYNGLEIQETDKEIVLFDNEFVYAETISDKLLQKAKDEKHAESLAAAYAAEENGTVLYKDALFETSMSNMSKIATYLSMLNIGAISSVLWLSKDDKQIEFIATDLLALGHLISEYTGALWNVQYLINKEKIQECKTIEEVKNLEIIY